MDSTDFLKRVCYEMPKADIHIHLEGTITAEFAAELVKRNKISEFPYQSQEKIREYMSSSKTLDGFMEIYANLTKLLTTEEDFVDLAYNYIKKSAGQGMIYTEIAFDPQRHAARGISFEQVFNGISAGAEKAKKEFGVEYQLIMAIVAEFSMENCYETVRTSLAYKDRIVALSLDCSPHQHPETTFVEFMKFAKSQGYKLTAHIGLEGTFEEFKQSYFNLDLDRIDHGYLVTQDKEFVEFCREKQVVFTCCPGTNDYLEYPDLVGYPMKEMLESGLLVSANADDPAIVDLFIGDNYYLLVRKNNFTLEQLIKISINSIRGSFLDKEKQDELLKKLDNYIENLNKPSI